MKKVLYIILIVSFIWIGCDDDNKDQSDQPARIDISEAKSLFLAMPEGSNPLNSWVPGKASMSAKDPLHSIQISDTTSTLNMITDDGEIKQVKFFNSDGEEIAVETERIREIGDGYVGMELIYNDSWYEVVSSSVDGKLYNLEMMDAITAAALGDYIYAWGGYSFWTIYRINVKTGISEPLFDPNYATGSLVPDSPNADSNILAVNGGHVLFGTTLILNDGSAIIDNIFNDNIFLENGESTLISHGDIYRLNIDGYINDDYDSSSFHYIVDVSKYTVINNEIVKKSIGSQSVLPSTEYPDDEFFINFGCLNISSTWNGNYGMVGDKGYIANSQGCAIFDNSTGTPSFNYISHNIPEHPIYAYENGEYKRNGIFKGTVIYLKDDDGIMYFDYSDLAQITWYTAVNDTKIAKWWVVGNKVMYVHKVNNTTYQTYSVIPGSEPVLVDSSSMDIGYIQELTFN